MGASSRFCRRTTRDVNSVPCHAQDTQQQRLAAAEHACTVTWSTQLAPDDMQHSNAAAAGVISTGITEVPTMSNMQAASHSCAQPAVHCDPAAIATLQAEVLQTTVCHCHHTS